MNKNSSISGEKGVPRGLFREPAGRATGPKAPAMIGEKTSQQGPSIVLGNEIVANVVVAQRASYMLRMPVELRQQLDLLAKALSMQDMAKSVVDSSTLNSFAVEVLLHLMRTAGSLLDPGTQDPLETFVQAVKAWRRSHPKDTLGMLGGVLAVLRETLGWG